MSGANIEPEQADRVRAATRSAAANRSEQPRPMHLPPHPVLEHHYDTPAQKDEFVHDLFDETAGSYDWINTLLSLGTGRRHRRAELRRAAIEEGMRVLDVGTGTGVLADLARQRTGPTGRVIGLDPSAGMLRRAPGRHWHPVQATAEHLPLPDASVDRLTMGYALRHVADLSLTFSEYYRVLRPRGRVLFLELRCPPTGWQRLLLKAHLKHLVPAVARLRGQRLRRLMRYYWDTIERCVPPETITNALSAAGFVQARAHITGRVFVTYTAVKPAPESDPAPLA